MPQVRPPVALEAEWSSDPEWLAGLPRLAAECAAQWRLELEEEVFDSPRALVVPAADVVLKLNAPAHRESDHEADALELWAGGGAVRLVARDDARRALLIERCRPGTPLRDSGADEQTVVTGLLSRLSRDLGSEQHPFRALAEEAERWAVEVPARYARGDAPFERSLLARAVDVFLGVDRSATWLVNQDLHGENVLRATREPWLAIDPKPLIGERELDGVGLLRNAAAHGGAAAVRRWLDVLGELGLDRDRLRDWGLAHALAWGWDERSGWSTWSIEVARTIAAAR